MATVGSPSPHLLRRHTKRGGVAHYVPFDRTVSLCGHRILGHDRWLADPRLLDRLPVCTKCDETRRLGGY